MSKTTAGSPEGGWLAAVALALAQSSCVWLWLAVLGHGSSGGGASLAGLPAAVVGLHALCAAALPVALRRRGWPAERRTVALFGAALAAIGLTCAVALVRQGAAPPFAPGAGPDGAGLVLAAVGLAILWWRGVAMAAEEFAYDAVLAEWRAWTVALVPALLGGAATLALNGGTGWAVGAFLCGGLVAIAASWRRRLARRHQTRLLAVGSPWPATLGLTTLAIFLPALLGAALAGPSFTAALLGALGTLVDLVFFVLSPLLLAAGWLAAMLIEAVRALERRAGIKQRTPTLPAIQASRSQHVLQTVQAPPWVFWVAVLLLVAVALAVFFVLLRRATLARSAAPVDEEETREERETLLSWREIWRSLLARLHRLGRAPDSAAASGVGLPLPEGSMVGATLTIRDIYRGLLALGASLGIPRASTETPHEYLARLRPRMADHEKDASVITAIYVHARYGPSPSTPRDAERARASWGRLATSTPPSVPAREE